VHDALTRGEVRKRKKKKKKEEEKEEEGERVVLCDFRLYYTIN
jgi:hypothetical protein